MIWRDALDPFDLAEFERLCEGKPVSEEFESRFSESEMLQGFFEEVMRTDEIGIFIKFGP